jgi:hypothetical protein
MLATQLRNPVRRVSVSLPGNSVTTKASIGQNRATIRVTISFGYANGQHSRDITQ